MVRTLENFFLYRPDTFLGWVWLCIKWPGGLALLYLLVATIVGVFSGAERPALIRRYLLRKLAPIFAILAVALCTAMVIIVISVMGGFLRMVMATTKTLEGEVAVNSYRAAGLPYYQELTAELQQLPQVASAAPVINSYGAVNFGEEVVYVEVLGIDPPALNKVVDYQKALYWKTDHLLEYLKRFEDAHPPIDRGQREYFDQRRRDFEHIDPQAAGMTLQPGPEWNYLWSSSPDGSAASGPAARTPPPGIVLGMHVSRYNRRDPQGQYHLTGNSALGRTVKISVMPLSEKGGFLDPKGRLCTVVNEFKSGLYDIDKSRVYVSFDVLQSMLQMDAYAETDPDTGKPTGVMAPARASQVLIKGKPDVELGELKAAVEARVRAFMETHPDLNGRLWVDTWKERHATFLGAVEKEKFMVTILFAVVSVVGFAMIGVVFYMIVLEKTRDIGTLRALGASRNGIASVFLGYGLIIGVLGSVLGLTLAFTIVTYINEIQDFLGRTVGFKMWDPEIYYFDRIPNRLDPTEVAWIIFAALVASVLGARIPAWRAARLNPVESLRYE